MQGDSTHTCHSEHSEESKDVVLSHSAILLTGLTTITLHFWP